MTDEEAVRAGWESQFPKIWVASYNVRLGQAIMRQKTASDNSEIVAVVMLADKEQSDLISQKIADVFRDDAAKRLKKGQQ